MLDAESDPPHSAQRAARLSYVGGAGWELSCEMGRLANLYDVLVSAGAGPASLFAQTSMRIEKGFLAMGHDLNGGVSPAEAGLEFTLKRNADFIGRRAAEQRAAHPAKRRVCIVLDDESANPLGARPSTPATSSSASSPPRPTATGSEDPLP